MLRLSRRGALMAVICLAFALAACGDDGENAGPTTRAATDSTTTSTTEPEPEPAAVDEWGADVCGALTEWNDGLEEIGADFEKDAEAVTDGNIDRVRTLLTDFFGVAADRTQELSDDLAGLDAPDLDEGDEVAAEIRKAVSKVQGEFASLSNEVAALSSDLGPQEFSDALDALNEDFQTNIEEIGTAFDDFEARFGDDGAALDEVFADDPACADVGA